MSIVTPSISDVVWLSLDSCCLKCILILCELKDLKQFIDILGTAAIVLLNEFLSLLETQQNLILEWLKMECAPRGHACPEDLLLITVSSWSESCFTPFHHSVSTLPVMFPLLLPTCCDYSTEES